RDVPHQHEIIVLTGLGEGALERFGGAFAVAAVELFIGADHALGRIEQAFAVGVVADIGDQRAYRGLGLLARRAVGDRPWRGADVIAQGGGTGAFWERLDDPGLCNGVHRTLRSTRAG